MALPRNSAALCISLVSMVSLSVTCFFGAAGSAGARARANAKSALRIYSHKRQTISRKRLSHRNVSLSPSGDPGALLSAPVVQVKNAHRTTRIRATISPVQELHFSNEALSRLKLPIRLRSRLVERFDLFIQYERTQSYDKQFDLLAKTHLATLLHMNPTKESYIKFKQETEIAVGKLLGLRINRIRRTSNALSSLSFSVVAKLQKGKSTYSDRPIFVAYLVNENWYFSLLYIN